MILVLLNKFVIKGLEKFGTKKNVKNSKGKTKGGKNIGGGEIEVEKLKAGAEGMVKSKG